MGIIKEDKLGLDVIYLPRDASPVSEVARDHGSWLQEAEPLPCTRDASTISEGQIGK